MAAGAARIRITYQVDADGLLSVSARELRSGVETSVTIKPSYGLTDGEVAKMLQESFASANQDMQIRALKEEQVEAERILLATQSAIENDTALLTQPELEAIQSLMDKVREAMHSEDHGDLKANVSALADGTEEFAARRMDQSVRSALAGKKLSSFS